MTTLNQDKTIDKPLLFDGLNNDILVDTIPSVAPEKEAMQIMGLLSNTCWTGHSLFMEELDKRAAAKLAPLLVSAEKNNIKKVIDMVKNNPRLLLVKIAKVKDKVGRLIRNATLLQLAYGAGDDDLCLQLKPFFEKLCGSKAAGEAEIRKQINERFGRRGDVRVPDLKAVMDEITNENYFHDRDVTTGKLILYDATLKAIEAYRQAFEASQSKIIDEGMHFDFKILMDVCMAYKKQADEIWNYGYMKCTIFEDGILSFILRYLPENDAAKFSQGLRYLQDRYYLEEFKRTLTTCDGDDFYDALRLSSIDYLLVGSCVNICEHGPQQRGKANLSLDLVERLQKWFQAKTERLAILCGEPVAQNRLGCR